MKSDPRWAVVALAVLVLVFVAGRLSVNVPAVASAPAVLPEETSKIEAELNKALANLQRQAFEMGQQKGMAYNQVLWLKRTRSGQQPGVAFWQEIERNAQAYRDNIGGDAGTLRDLVEANVKKAEGLHDR